MRLGCDVKTCFDDGRQFDDCHVVVKLEDDCLQPIIFSMTVAGSGPIPPLPQLTMKENKSTSKNRLFWILRQRRLAIYLWLGRSGKLDQIVLSSFEHDIVTFAILLSSVACILEELDRLGLL